MKRFLIVYSSRYGQTRKIAHAFESELNRLGNQVVIFDVATVSSYPELGSIDAVIVGAPVYKSCFPRNIEMWLKKEIPSFARKPSMFFSVCLGVLEKDNAQVQADERQIVESLFARTGWRPQMWAIVAGAITYTKYNWLIRFVMKRIAKKAGGGTDASQDYEYTDWEEVRRIAREFASKVE